MNAIDQRKIREKYIVISSNTARANKFYISLLHCQNNMKLAFRISEDGSEIAR
jgi:hypothetical protein